MDERKEGGTTKRENAENLPRDVSMKGVPERNKRTF
jgi:hypothetical protein